MERVRSSRPDHSGVAVGSGAGRDQHEGCLPGRQAEPTAGETARQGAEGKPGGNDDVDVFDGVGDRDGIHEHAHPHGVLPADRQGPGWQRVHRTPGTIHETQARFRTAQDGGVAFALVEREHGIQRHEPDRTRLEKAVVQDHRSPLDERHPADELAGAVAPEDHPDGVAPILEHLDLHGILHDVGVAHDHDQIALRTLHRIRRESHRHRPVAEHGQESHRGVAPIARRAVHGSQRVPTHVRLHDDVRSVDNGSRPGNGSVGIGPDGVRSGGRTQCPSPGVVGCVRPELDGALQELVVASVQPEGQRSVARIGEVARGVGGGTHLQLGGCAAREHQGGVAATDHEFVGGIGHHHRPFGVHHGVAMDGGEDSTHLDLVGSWLQAHQGVQPEPPPVAFASTRQTTGDLAVGEVGDPEGVRLGLGHDAAQDRHHRRSETVGIVRRDHDELSARLLGDVVEDPSRGHGGGGLGDHESEHGHGSVGGQRPGDSLVGRGGTGQEHVVGCRLVARLAVGDHDDRLVRVGGCGHGLAVEGFGSFQQHAGPSQHSGVVRPASAPEGDRRLDVVAFHRIGDVVELGGGEVRFEGEIGRVGTGGDLAVELDGVPHDVPALVGRIAA